MKVSGRHCHLLVVAGLAQIEVAQLAAPRLCVVRRRLDPLLAQVAPVPGLCPGVKPSRRWWVIGWVIVPVHVNKEERREGVRKDATGLSALFTSGLHVVQKVVCACHKITQSQNFVLVSCTSGPAFCLSGESSCRNLTPFGPLALVTGD